MILVLGDVLLDKFLQNHIFNYIFVTFCILIVINGSNFFDGLLDTITSKVYFFLSFSHNFIDILLLPPVIKIFFINLNLTRFHSIKFNLI